MVGRGLVPASNELPGVFQQFSTSKFTDPTPTIRASNYWV